MFLPICNVLAPDYQTSHALAGASVMVASGWLLRTADWQKNRIFCFLLAIVHVIFIYNSHNWLVSVVCVVCANITTRSNLFHISWAVSLWISQIFKFTLPIQKQIIIPINIKKPLSPINVKKSWNNSVRLGSKNYLYMIKLWAMKCSNS